MIFSSSLLPSPKTQCLPCEAFKSSFTWLVVIVSVEYKTLQIFFKFNKYCVDCNFSSLAFLTKLILFCLCLMFFFVHALVILDLCTYRT